MNKVIFLLAFFSLALLCQISNAQNKARQFHSMDQNWSFYPGDKEEAYKTCFNDNDWRKLNVPHDWSIELPIEKDK